jgi:[ribosomal protein S5]-alanine N-acetyltransferase
LGDAPVGESSADMAAQPVLETDRLYLLPLAREHTAPLHAACADPEVMRYVDFPLSQSIHDTARRVDMFLLDLPDWHATWVLSCKQTAAIMGFVNYHHRENCNWRLEVGFVLARAYWGQRFMGEAMQALLEYCFLGFAMNRVEVTVNPGNRAAIRLIERLGFQFEGGPLRGRQYVCGEYRDLLIFGLLRREWTRSYALKRAFLPDAGQFPAEPPAQGAAGGLHAA